MNEPLTTLLVGLGSPHGDDAVGWRIAELVAAAEVPGLVVRQASSPLDLLDWLEDIDRLIVCDACESATGVGSVHVWQWPDAAIESRRGNNTHAIGLVETLQLAKHLGRLPPDVRIYAIGGSQFHAGSPLAIGLAAVLPEMAARLIGDLAHARTLAGSGAA